jgi:hypothetical protein
LKEGVDRKELANQQSREPSFEALSLFSLFCSRSLFETVILKKNKNFDVGHLPSACHRCIVRCFSSLLRAATAPQQQHRSVAATRAKVVPQRCRKAYCNSVATPVATVPQRRELQQRCHDACCNSAATLPRHVLQQRRSTAVTRAAAL